MSTASFTSPLVNTVCLPEIEIRVRSRKYLTIDYMKFNYYFIFLLESFVLV